MKCGASNSLLKELKVANPLAYPNILRIDCTHFDLLQLVDEMLKRRTDTKIAMAVATKLEFTLLYLATRNFFKSIKYLFRVPKSTISKFLPKLLSAISCAIQLFIEVIFYLFLCL